MKSIGVKMSFPKMVNHLQEGETEHFALEHFEVSESELRFAQLRDVIKQRSEHDGLQVGQRYVRLIKKHGFRDIIMSDTPMEQRENSEFVSEARGDVFIAGLGLGMILLAVQSKTEVTSITIVEKEQEIIDLVATQLPLNKKVTIVCADVFEYQTDKKFDTLYFDIWDNLCGDNWEEMKKLHAKFRRNRKKKSWMSSWRKEEHQRLHRSGW